MADPPQTIPRRALARAVGALARLTYGAYAWILFAALGAASIPVLLLTPGLRRRRALVRALARGVLWLVGMLVRLLCPDRIVHPCVVVANHTSYLDGVVMAGALPPHFSYVIKREMSSVPLAGTLLRRIGAEFVERHDRHRGASDARRLLRNAALGQSLVFFPEGTFSTRVGLLRFHMGAFTAAARADLVVVPVVIRGTRACLPPGHLMPLPGAIEVEVLPALARHAGLPAGDPAVAAALRDAARSALLQALGEPDLAAHEANGAH